MSDAFATAFSATMKNEGGYSNVKSDRGGETYMGISRVFWPSWTGWEIVDACSDGEINALQRDVSCADHVRAFYRVQFWERFQGDAVAAESVSVACELFDTGVNMGIHRAVCFLQEALNMQNQYAKTYPDISVDGQLGKGTVSTLKRYLTYQPGTRADNEQILLNCMNGEQYVHYKKNAQHEQFRGWFRRV